MWLLKWQFCFDVVFEKKELRFPKIEKVLMWFLKEEAKMSQATKSLDVLTWFLREGAKISQGRKSLDVLTWFLREGAKISQGTKSLDVLTWFFREGFKFSQAIKSLDVLTWFLKEEAKISQGRKSLDVVFERRNENTRMQCRTLGSKCLLPQCPLRTWNNVLQPSALIKNTEHLDAGASQTLPIFVC